MLDQKTRCLASTYYLDFDHVRIQELIADLKKEKAVSDQKKAVALYLIIRDGWRYDPYKINLSREHFKASRIAGKSSGNCVEKSILLIACLRGLGIPARLQLGKVKNHIAVERLIEKFGSNELTPHGMVNVYLNGQWLKVSPAFNASLCERFRVEPLEFDGENHSFLQQYNREGSLFMEYLEDYGPFEDVPVDFIKQNIREHYPHIFVTDENGTEV